MLAFCVANIFKYISITLQSGVRPKQICILAQSKKIRGNQICNLPSKDTYVWLSVKMHFWKKCKRSLYSTMTGSTLIARDVTLYYLNNHGSLIGMAKCHNRKDVWKTIDITSALYPGRKIHRYIWGQQIFNGGAELMNSFRWCFQYWTIFLRKQWLCKCSNVSEETKLRQQRVKGEGWNHKHTGPVISAGLAQNTNNWTDHIVVQINKSTLTGPCTKTEEYAWHCSVVRHGITTVGTIKSISMHK